MRRGRQFAILFAGLVLWFSAVVSYAIWFASPQKSASDKLWLAVAIFLFIVGLLAFIIAAPRGD
jgi:hypothetical protein